MKSTELIAQCENLTHRKIDYWLQQGGVFHNGHVDEPRHSRRDFTDEDLRVAQVLARVSAAFDVWSGGRGGFIAVYREIADQIRAGANPVSVTLAPGINITVVVDNAPDPDPEPIPEPEPEPEAVEVGFIPGVGADNA